MFDFTGGKRYKVSLYALVIIGCITWGCLLLVGCKRKPVPTSTQFGYVSFTVRWDSISKQGMPNDVLRFCFYPADNGPMIQTDTDSGTLKIALSPGKYGLLVYNYGKDNFQLRNRTHFDAMEVAFKEGENGHAKTPTLPVYGIVIPEFEVKPNQDITTTITPTFFTKNVYFKVNIPPKYHKQIVDCRGVLSGVSPFLSIPNRTIKRNATTTLSLPFGKNDLGFENQTILLDGAYNAKEENVSHQLTLNFTLKNGQHITSTIDMGLGLLSINQQNIQVHIDALVNMEAEPEINLVCKSIDACPNIQ